MKTLRIFAFSAALASAGTMLVAAQEQAPANPPAMAAQGEHRQADPSRQVKHMAKQLNLSADQQSQLLPILTARRDQVQSLRNDSSLSNQDRRSKMQALRSDTDGKIRALLNEDQRKSYDQMQQQQHDRMANRRASNGGSIDNR